MVRDLTIIMTYVLKPIETTNLNMYRQVRLSALHDAPSAFGSTYDTEIQFTDAEWRERVARMDGKGSIGFLALKNEAGVGIIVCFVGSPDTRHATLMSMWVAPSHRGQGVGRELVAAAVDWAASRGAHTVRLMVTSNNHRAIGFYEGVGFEFTGMVEPYRNDASLTEIEMVRNLW